MSIVMFLAFVAAFLFPAIVLVSRAPYVRDLPPDLRFTAAAIVVVLLSTPWYFARKALGMPLAFDAVTCVVLIALAVRKPFELRTSRLTLAVPVVFSLAWLGYAARAGYSVRFHELFASGFAKGVSIVSSLRASSMWPLAFVVDGGPLREPWFHFTLPAMLADFLGLSMPNANALILANLLIALLLVHTVASVAQGIWPAAIALFAVVAPVQSMIAFGDHTFVLILVLFAIAMFRRSAVVGAIAVMVAIAYSFPPGATFTKIASLIAVACAPLIAFAVRRAPKIAIIIAAIGFAYTAVYLLQFPWSRGETIPAGYHDALVWIRDHTPRNAVLFDPASVPVSKVLWPMVIAERRVWLPTRSTPAPNLGYRLREWQTSRPARGDVAVMVARCETSSSGWRTATRFGQWSVCVRRR